MAQTCGNAGLAAEPVDELGVVAARVGNDLERYVAIESQLARFEDASHPAAAEERLDCKTIVERFPDRVELRIDARAGYRRVERTTAAVAELRSVAIVPATQITEHGFSPS